MSTIKSSDEHLTLNADGSSKDIKFQANGVEKASISSAGAFTSTTIDATKLTGTIPNFTSTGIDDNADATAITISSDEKVGIGVTNPTQLLQIKQTGRYTDIGLETTNRKYVVGVDNDTSEWYVYDNNAAAFRMKITSDGRVVSQSNAHSWINYDQSGTIVIRDSYNVSSITDAATGYARIYFDVDHAQSYYAVSGMAGNQKRMTQDGAGLNSGFVAIYTQNHSGTTTADESRCFVITFGD